jgi:hypothetical protein
MILENTVVAYLNILRRVVSLLSNDRETNNCTTTVTRQRSIKSIRGSVFFERPVQRYCKQDNW